MVGMTPWGVFFLACKLPYTKCWLLCQQARCLSRCWGFASGSELDEDTVDRVAVLTRKLISQSLFKIF